MNPVTVYKLIAKDLRIMRPWVLWYWIGGVASVLLAMVGGETLALVAFIAFIATLGATGVHTIMGTVVLERTEHTRTFIMSLPITGREYVLAKVLANLLIFVSVWATLSAFSFAIFVGDALPLGFVPFFCILLVAILLAYTLMLTTSLLSEGMGWTVAATVVANIGTQMALWSIVGLPGIGPYLDGPEPVWNSTSVAVLFAEFVIIVACIVGATLFQFRRKDLV